MENVSITEFIGNDRNMLPNLDPDGVWSYLLLNKFIPCQICGFTNSREYVYLLHDKICKNITYIDMYVANREYKSIDQHIIARDSKDSEVIRSFGNKLNPNLIFDVDATHYTSKFPYSTFIFMMLLLSEEYDFDFDFNKKIHGTLELGHFMLDIDGVLINLQRYAPNCKFWLERLRNSMSNKRIIDKLIEYVNNLPILELGTISSQVRTFLRDNFNTETKDGGFKSIRNDNIDNIKSLFNFASQCMFSEDVKVFDDEQHTIVECCGEYNVVESTDVKDISSFFSYAIVRKNGKNFSYTLKPTKETEILVKT